MKFIGIFSLIFALSFWGITLVNAEYGSGSVTVVVSSAPQPPIVTVTASPSSVSFNGSSTISWISTNATSCSSPNTSSTATSASFPTGSLASNTTYTVSCTGAGGTSSGSATVTVGGAPSPTVTVTASPSSVSFNGSSTISWISTNATSCSSSTGQGGTSTTGTFSTGGLTSNTQYTVWCNGAGGTSSDSATVTVGSSPSGNLNVGTCSIPAYSNTCTTSFTWSTTNPIGTSSVTSPNLSPSTLFSANSGTNQPHVVPYGTSTYYLYNNGVPLDQKTINTDCEPGSTWISMFGQCTPQYIQNYFFGIPGPDSDGGIYNVCTVGYQNPWSAARDSATEQSAAVRGVNYVIVTYQIRTDNQYPYECTKYPTATFYPGDLQVPLNFNDGADPHDFTCGNYSAYCSQLTTEGAFPGVYSIDEH